MKTASDVRFMNTRGLVTARLSVGWCGGWPKSAGLKRRRLCVYKLASALISSELPRLVLFYKRLAIMVTTSSDINDKADNWRPKVVIFDLLTGLLDSWTLWDASTPSGTEEEGRRWRAQYLDITFRQVAYKPYEGFVRQAAEEAGVAASAPEALLSNWSKLKAWPEVFDVLQRLKAKGHKLGVVTNCSKIRGNIAATCAATSETGEQLVFDKVVTAEESGFYKPTKQAYDAILEAMGVDASDALFVAGSAGDVQGATNAGMRVVWHNHVGLPPKGSATPLREGRTLDDALLGFI